jgi:hypothetical protein
MFKNSEKIELPDISHSEFNWEIAGDEENSNTKSTDNEYRSMLKNTYKFDFKLHDFERLL